MSRAAEAVVIGTDDKVARSLPDLLPRPRSQPNLIAVETPLPPTPIHPVSEFHDRRSGHLRADRIAAWFLLSQDEMARLLEVSPRYLRSFPGAKRLQARLAVFEYIAAALLHIVGEEAAHVWLNLPNDEIDDIVPLALIKEGRGHIISDLLEDTLWGQPS